MRQIIASLVFILWVFPSRAQSDSSNNYELYFNSGCIDISPHFPGGHARMQKLFASTMKYPKEAERQGIEGTVRVGFTVDTFGRVTNVKIVQGIRDDLDHEASRLTRLLKHWTPGTVNGKKTIRCLVLPFIFKIDRGTILKHHIKPRKSTVLRTLVLAGE